MDIYARVESSGAHTHAHTHTCIHTLVRIWRIVSLGMSYERLLRSEQGLKTVRGGSRVGHVNWK